MATDSTVRYQKLPGRSIAFATGKSSTLWTGPDHLLLVAGTRFSEDYKRFYFSDIKAIVLRRTRQWELQLKIAGVITALAGLFAVFAMKMTHPNVGLAIFLGILGGIALFSLIFNLIAGPTCVCHLRTPVQQEEIPSLCRLRTARKTLKKIRPLIESVQGAMSEVGIGQIAAIAAGYTGEPENSGATRRQALWPPIVPPVPIEKTNVLWHGGLIATLLLNAGAVAYLGYARQSGAAFALEWCAVLGLGVLIIAGTAVHRSWRLGSWVRTGLWAVWILTLIGFSLAARIQQVISIAANPKIGLTMPPLASSLYSSAPGAAICFVLWAVVEFVLLMAERSQRSAAIQQPSAEPQSWNP